METLDKMYNGIKDISKLAEICITSENTLYCSETLAPSSAIPNLSFYEKKISNFRKLT